MEALPIRLAAAASSSLTGRLVACRPTGSINERRTPHPCLLGREHICLPRDGTGDLAGPPAPPRSALSAGQCRRHQRPPAARTAVGRDRAATGDRQPRRRRSSSASKAPCGPSFPLHRPGSSNRAWRPSPTTLPQTSRPSCAPTARNGGKWCRTRRSSRRTEACYEIGQRGSLNS